MSSLDSQRTPQGRHLVVRTSKVIDCAVALAVLHLFGMDAEVLRLLATML